MQHEIQLQIVTLQDVLNLDILLEKFTHLETVVLQLIQYFKVKPDYNALRTVVSKYPRVHFVVNLPLDLDHFTDKADLFNFVGSIHNGSIRCYAYSSDPFLLLRTCSDYRAVSVMMSYLSIDWCLPSEQTYPNVRTLALHEYGPPTTVDIDAVFKMFPGLVKLVVHHPRDFSLQNGWNPSCNLLSIDVIKQAHFSKLVNLLPHALPYLKILSIKFHDGKPSRISEQEIQHLDATKNENIQLLRNSFFAMIRNSSLKTLVIQDMKLNLSEVSAMLRSDTTIGTLSLGRIDWGSDGGNKLERFKAVLPVQFHNEIIRVSKESTRVNFHSEFNEFKES
ncbi:hypothetical protein HDE_00923 [Halotydeus destructor]|nr:hypothetical protein HDE_00923 [Halotydeus destructor]